MLKQNNKMKIFKINNKTKTKIIYQWINKTNFIQRVLDKKIFQF
jgi:hypothetical protein